MTNHRNVSTPVKGWDDPISTRHAEPSKRANRKSEDESQWIVAQRPLSAPTIPRFGWFVHPGFPSPVVRTSINTDPFNGWQGTCDIRSRPITCVPVLTGENINTPSSMDPNLEAFSGNPTDGSVAVLVFQPTALTKYLNELFLSY
jgi:hypothetical protein